MSRDGLCAIVTGSASGLGAATAAILAKGGARIVVNYSNSKAEAEATADLCRKAGADVVVVQGDVSRDEDCKKIAAAAAPWGGLDILVNNAGTTKHVPHARTSGSARQGRPKRQPQAEMIEMRSLNEISSTRFAATRKFQN